MLDKEEVALRSISPLDGRYAKLLTSLPDYFSEYALIKRRYLVEVEWLIFLSTLPGFKEIGSLNPHYISYLKDSAANFNLQDARKVKDLEKIYNHDVKAVEIFLQKKLAQLNISNVSAFVHFGLTSEDVNSIAYSSLLREFMLNCWQKAAYKLSLQIKQLAVEYRQIGMLSRTHGQVASPTTLGKELLVFHMRLKRQFDLLSYQTYYAKFGGAVSNFNLHLFTHPKINWLKTSQLFLDIFNLKHNVYTTQIEPHDFLAEIFDNCRRYNVVLLDFCRDIWGYISLGYLKQKIIQQETGSSVMPHKVNPINFENAEGNLGLANSFLNHLSSKLPISRWQRDLSDSTVLRNIGVAFGHSMLAIKFIERGLNRIAADQLVINNSLKNAWEVLTEVLQSCLRMQGRLDAYDYVKQKVRGKQLTEKDWKALVKGANLPPDQVKNLLKLKPESYLGYSNKFK